MKKIDHKIETETNRTMDLLFERTGPAEFNDPYLSDRIEALLKNENVRVFSAAFKSMNIAFAVLAILLFLNLYTLIEKPVNENTDEKVQTEFIEVFKEEYSLDGI